MNSQDPFTQAIQEAADQRAQTEQIQKRLREAEERTARMREEQARIIEQSNRQAERLQRAEKDYEKRTSRREKAGAATAGVGYALGGLPFVGAVARIIGAGLASAQMKDYQQMAADRSAGGTSPNRQPAGGGQPAQPSGGNVLTQGGQSRYAQQAATAQTRAGNAATQAASAQSRAATSTQAAAAATQSAAAAGGVGMVNPYVMAAMAAAEVVKYGIAGVAKFSPQTQERLDYQSDRMQAGAGAAFAPLVSKFADLMDKSNDLLFGKGFQLNAPQITANASDIRDRLQMSAAAGAPDPKGGLIGGVLSNPNTSGLGATIGSFIGSPLGPVGSIGGANVGDKIEEGISDAWKWATTNKGSRGALSVWQ